MYSMPPAITGPGPYIDPPLARMPLTVVNSRLLLNDHTTDPSAVEYARSPPSFDGEKTTPGITVTAENCAPLQPRPGLPHSGTAGAANHARAPVARSTACSPPGAAL